MCGLAGRILTYRSANTLPLTAGMPWLARRGPDHQGVWTSDDGRIELMHSRLPTVDPLPRSNQPLVDERHGLVVVFNGEIYNYREVRRDYHDFGYRTECDTEVIISAYQAEGVEGFRKFRGAFSFALVDLRARRVMLVRDPVGTKPLLVANWGGTLLFASSIMAMAAVQGGELAINEEAAEDFWELEYILPHRTVLRGATTVRPGQVLVYDFEGDLVGETDCRPTGGPVHDGETRDEVVRRVRGLLCQALGRCTGDDHLPTILLSGGIDSTVLSDLLMTELNGRELKISALTMGSVIPLSYDERYGRYAGWRLGLPLRVVYPHFKNLSDEIAFAFEIQDEPLGMISFFQLCTLLRSAKESGRVVLVGDGGDEAFCGFGEFARWTDRNARGQPPYVEHGISLQCGPAPPPWMGTWARHIVTDSMMGHGFAKSDRAASEQAVILRAPFLDWDLLHYVRTIPPEMLLHGGRPKALLLDLLAHWPNWFVNRRKGGFAYNLRWIWLVSGYNGLRELADRTAIERFEERLPPALRQSPGKWRTRDIHRHFRAAWKVAAWSTFERRLVRAAQGLS